MIATTPPKVKAAIQAVVDLVIVVVNGDVGGGNVRSHVRALGVAIGEVGGIGEGGEGILIQEVPAVMIMKDLGANREENITMGRSSRSFIVVRLHCP